LAQYRSQTERMKDSDGTPTGFGAFSFSGVIVGAIEENFLRRAMQGAGDSGHIFPAYAACEAELESAWGRSRLAVAANNLFGQKQSKPPLAFTQTLMLPTREFLLGEWTTVNASWVKFASWSDCFRERMRLLRRLSPEYPHYAAALAARTGEQFILKVSQTWSTDPGRARKVLAIHDAHRDLLQVNPLLQEEMSTP
jgi:flagellum-specific peptidoglycan hydrolase FlgJ